ncbi:MAG: hypothetical protein OXI67_13490 [Candidatus Poribacteria bacterium]|nr:hypothetical protein [Candidatus Poribacteria bacterium]
MQNLISTFKLNAKRNNLIGMLAVSLFIFTQSCADAYIAKRYTIPQIANESSNIVFGTITEVNTNRKTANFKVEQNLKGRSEFEVIRIRFDVFKGEADHRKELAQFLKQGESIIVCYLQEGGRIDALAHTRGKWFQLQLIKDRERGWGRWSFTHFEKYLNKDKVSRRDSTPEFQKELSSMFGEDAIQLLLLYKDDYEAEIPIISGINKVKDNWIAYNQTEDRNLPGLNRTNILWLGCRSIGRDGRYKLNNGQEKRIKDFVKNGGVVIVSGQDSDPESPCGDGWLPEPLKGVESKHRNDFQTTSKAGDLFKAPHRIRSGNLSLDDSWNGWNDKYEVLATTNGGKEIVIAKLRYGKGMYLVTSLHNNRKEQVAQNRGMLENLMHYAVAYLDRSK